MGHVESCIHKMLLSFPVYPFVYVMIRSPGRESAVDNTRGDTTFGGRVRAQRVHSRGMSQRVFAAAAGVDPLTLSKVEADLVAPWHVWDEPTIRRVADLLDDGAAELLALARRWVPPAPEALGQRPASPPPRRCLRCGRDMTEQTAYHETASGGLICVDHLDPIRDYWTRG